MRGTKGRECQTNNFQKFWHSCAQNNTSEISKHGLSWFLGLLCSEQDVGSLNKCTFKKSGTPVCRARRRKSQKIDFQEFWDSCAQNKTSEISKNALSRTLGIGSLTIILARIWGWGRRGGCAPPHPPASWGAATPRPPKRRSAPLAAVVGLFSLDRVTCPWRLPHPHHPLATTLNPQPPTTCQYNINQ